MDYRIILNFSIIFIPAIAITLLSPSLALYLQETLEISPAGTGYIIGINSIVYMVTCPFVGWATKKLNRKLVIFISIILCAMSTIIVGEEQYLGLPNSLLT